MFKSTPKPRELNQTEIEEFDLTYADGEGKEEIKPSFETTGIVWATSMSESDPVYRFYNCGTNHLRILKYEWELDRWIPIRWTQIPSTMIYSLLWLMLLEMNKDKIEVPIMESGKVNKNGRIYPENLLKTMTIEDHIGKPFPAIDPFSSFHNTLLNDNIPESILKIMRIAQSPKICGDLFTEYPLHHSDDPIYFIKMEKWYHSFWSKRWLKWLKYLYSFKYDCLCDCHFRHGFYHCWDADCCDNVNKQYREKK